MCTALVTEYTETTVLDPVGQFVTVGQLRSSRVGQSVVNLAMHTIPGTSTAALDTNCMAY